MGEEYTYERDIDVKRCRQNVERYLEDAEEYGQCLRDKAEAADATAKQIKQHFECKSSGSDDCQ